MIVKEVIESYFALNKLLGTKIKGSTSFKISKILQKLKLEHTAFQVTRKAVIKNAGLEKHVDEATGMLVIKEKLNEVETAKLHKKFGAVCDEINKIGEQKSEFKLKQNISNADLTTADGKEIDVEPGIFLTLDWLITQ